MHKLNNYIPELNLRRQALKAKSSRLIARVKQTLHEYTLVLLEPMLAAVIIIFLSPLLILRALLALFITGRIFTTRRVTGKQGKHFSLLSFSAELKGRRLACLINILKGELAFVGPQINSRIDPERLSVRPGLFSIYSVRKNVCIAHDDELHTDREYIYRQSPVANMAIFLRNMLGLLLAGSANRPTPDHIELFDLSVSNIDMDEAVELILNSSSSVQKSQLAFVNPDCLNIAWTHPDYKNVLQASQQLLPDGIGIHLGCRILDVALKANVNGTDLFPKLCARVAQTGQSLFLLGARPGVAQTCADNMLQRFPGLNICGTHDGYFDDAQAERVIDEINQANPSILLVAMGAPLQELWIAEHRAKLQVKVTMGVGGLFDFYSGEIARAPLWLREMGMEWCWRIVQEPARMWRRYVIGNPVFLYRVWRYGKRSQGHKKITPNKRHELKSNLINWYALTLLQRNLWRHSETLQRSLKRLFDISVSGAGLFLLSPLLVLVALAIQLESPGPVFFKQVRVGRAGREFKFWKFRSMYIDAEQRKTELLKENEMQGGVIFKMRNDPRITRVGRFIRRSSIDELPQLWNVLRGDMSLVGPRPCLPTEAREYSVYDRFRLDAEPGITCTWQVSGRSDIPFEQQVKMDVEYVHQASWKKDFMLLIKTIPAVFSGRGAY